MKAKLPLPKGASIHGVWKWSDVDIGDLLCYLYVKSGSAETSGKTAIDFKSSEFHFQYVYLHYFFFL